MTYEDQILTEQNFPYKNLKYDERSFYLNLILNSKELCDSELSLNDKSSSKYELVCLALDNQGSSVKFDGCIANEDERRMIYGYITRLSLNKYRVHMTVYRLCDIIFEDDDKEYTVDETFKFKDKSVVRCSTYENRPYYETEIDFDEDEAEKFLQNKANKMRTMKID